MKVTDLTILKHSLLRSQWNDLSKRQ